MSMPLLNCFTSHCHFRNHTQTTNQHCEHHSWGRYHYHAIGAVSCLLRNVFAGTPHVKDKTAAKPDPVCLIRATLGTRKISTEVSQKDLPKFQQVCERVFSLPSGNWSEMELLCCNPSFKPRPSLPSPTPPPPFLSFPLRRATTELRHGAASQHDEPAEEDTHKGFKEEHGHDRIGGGNVQRELMKWMNLQGWSEKVVLMAPLCLVAACPWRWRRPIWCI